MVVGGEIHQSALWSRQALERLTQDGLHPTPRNYAVYYHYFSQSTPALNVAYDTLVARGKMTQPQCDALYDKFIVTDAEASFFKGANSVIDAELKKVMDLLSESVKGTDDFGQNLDQFSGKLARADSLQMLREAVESIVVETSVVSAQNRKLRSELEITSTQLNDMRESFERVHKEAQLDALTQVGNRKFFDSEIIHAMAEAREQKSVLSLLMVDIDHFKKFNDLHGHLIGDQVLRLVARTLIENLKGRDVIARYGGEEFVILLPQTRLQDAERVANQLRSSLATKSIRKRGSQEILGVVTISIGAAQYLLGEESDALVARADVALYKAKQTGRNKVVCAGVEEGQM